MEDQIFLPTLARATEKTLSKKCTQPAVLSEKQYFGHRPRCQPHGSTSVVECPVTQTQTQTPTYRSKFMFMNENEYTEDLI